MSAALAVGRGAFGRITPDPLDRPMRRGARSERRRGFRLSRPTATVAVGDVARSLEAGAVAIDSRQPQGLTPAAGGLAPGAIIADRLERPSRRGQRSAEEGGGTAQHPVLRRCGGLAARRATQAAVAAIRPLPLRAWRPCGLALPHNRAGGERVEKK